MKKVNLGGWIKGVGAKIKNGCSRINCKMNTIIIVVSVLILLVCLFGVLGLGVYKFHWNNVIVNASVKILPFPAGTVDGRIVRISEWQKEVKAVKQLNSQREAGLSDEAIEYDVLDKLIHEKIFMMLAKEFDEEVTDDDMDKAMIEITEQSGGEEKLAESIEEFFGWDLETFKKRIVEGEVLKSKLIASDALFADAREKSENVLEEIRKGDKTFEELAGEYSEDPGSAANGGELDWFPRGVMVEEFENAAFALNSGEISDLIKTQFGYHIIMVEEKRGEGETEEVHARHILVLGENFGDYLEEFKKDLKIRRFVGPDVAPVN
jgi:parvulin-like peptidyl-prolyl isomerase